LEPDLTRLNFMGRVEILLEAGNPVHEITLDVLELAISSCKANVQGEFVDCSFRVDPRKKAVTIFLPNEMAGRIFVKIDYVGSINDKMTGFYRSKFITEGQTKYVAVTQFEESDARRAFPCFDHPEKKATFDIEMILSEE